MLLPLLIKLFVIMLVKVIANHFNHRPSHLGRHYCSGRRCAYSHGLAHDFFNKHTATCFCLGLTGACC